jgi:hypothetical protein
LDGHLQNRRRRTRVCELNFCSTHNRIELVMRMFTDAGRRRLPEV